MSECGCASNVRLKHKDPITVMYEGSSVDRSKCKLHSDAALAAKEAQYQANMEDLRQQRDNAIDDCTRQLTAMFDREQLATKSAESLSCMVEQLKGEAGNRIVEAARLREDIVAQRRKLIAKDERIRELEAELAILRERLEPHGCDSCGKPCDCGPVHTGDEAWCQCPDPELAQLRQQVEAEVWEAAAKVAETVASSAASLIVAGDTHRINDWRNGKVDAGNSIAVEIRRRAGRK